jgi:hypothetical protein
VGFIGFFGSGPSFLSCGVFLPPPLLQAFLLLVAGCVLPLLPSLAGLFIYNSMSNFSSPPSLLSVFFVVIAYYSVFFFFPWVGSVCPGGYADLAQGCLWEYCVQLSSPCDLHLPKWCGLWCLAAARVPSWFLCLTWSGNVMCGLGVWRVKVLPLLSGFSYKVYLQCLPKILL